MTTQNPFDPAQSQGQGSNPFDDQSTDPAATASSGQPPVPEDTTPANFKLGEGLPVKFGITIPAHQLSFDENHFLRLLAGSISLSKDEKKRIIETIPKLKQSQVDELIKIFEEESFKFSQLSAKHVPQLQKLAKAHLQDWQDLETETKASAKKQEDTAAADEIRKSLGL